MAVCLQWLANFPVSQSFPPMVSASGAGPVFLGYAVMGLVATAFVLRLVTETKGRSLEEIESDLQEATHLGRRNTRLTHEPAR